MGVNGLDDGGASRIGMWPEGTALGRGSRVEGGATSSAPEGPPNAGAASFACGLRTLGAGMSSSPRAPSSSRRTASMRRAPMDF